MLNRDSQKKVEDWILNSEGLFLIKEKDGVKKCGYSDLEFVPLGRNP